MLRNVIQLSERRPRTKPVPAPLREVEPRESTWCDLLLRLGDPAPPKPGEVEEQ